ncbi:glycosyltransferase family 39 protein [Steroidobacter cummioxidans]|uniref:glycosyltransferase family 39 protein n=1 Tax=Steroidobacter cummioxidans TaxID=1803913 RepID=UPI000E313311|nr:glycosyltransferase family 39 protein [Steroidobacter cummioxidans]
MSSLMTQEMRLRATPLAASQLIYVSLALALLTAIWFLLPAGRPLTHPDEGRYAEIPREMLVSGDWVTPRLNDLPYLEKPPLQYWATALSYKVFGPSEWSARLCLTLSAWLNVVLIFLLGRRLWDTGTGAIAAALLGSSLLYFVMGQLLTLDMTFTFLLTAMLCCFCMAQLNRISARRASGWWMLLSWAMLGLAVMTKGIVALLIAGSVLSIYMLWQRDWDAWRALRLLPGLAIVLIITVPWFVLASRANPDFLQFFFVHEHLQRYLTDNADRVEAWWYFIAIFAAGTLPWTWQMSSALLRGWRTTAPRGQFDVCRLLWVWCIFLMVFFSVSGSKLPPYILPVLPALALLTAARQTSTPMRSLDLSAWILIASAAALIAFTLIAPNALDNPVVRSTAYEARPMAVAYALTAAVAALFYYRAAKKEQRVGSFVSLAVGWFLGLSLLFATVGRDGELRSGKDLTASIPTELAARAPMFTVFTYDQTLPFYLQRTMILVEYRGELDYGLQHEPEKGLGMEEFQQRWRAAPEAIAIMPHLTYEQLTNVGLPMRVLGTDRYRVAVSRR